MKAFSLLAILLVLIAGVLSCRETKVSESPRASQTGSQAPQYVVELADLIDPRELDELTGKRAATPRLREACFWLAKGREQGEELEAMIDDAHGLLGYPQGHRTREQKRALLENLELLRAYGCLSNEGMSKLRTSNAPRVERGEFAEEVLTVVHVLPRSKVPELDNRLYNLRFLPETLNQRKGAKITEREQKLAREWHAMGLLSSEGLAAVVAKTIE